MRTLLSRRPATPVADGVTAEPSEVRARNLLVTLALVAGPPVLLFLYYRMMFTGLTNADAMDFAQLGRNLSSGHGFVTDILRPLALKEGVSPLRQPDVTHGPLYPFVLAIAIGALGAKDAVVAWVSAAFYLLTIPAVYVLGRRVFSRPVGILSAAIFAVSALSLEYAFSGLNITLYIFLATCLLIAFHKLAVYWQDNADNPQVRVPRSLLALTGALTGALYLTDYAFAWLIPVLLVGVILVSPRRFQAALWFTLALGVVAFPWMVRNAVVTGNPIFGLRAMELWMNTRLYQDLQAYRMVPADIVPGQALLKAVIRKVLLGVGQVIQAFPQLSTIWVLAFFLPSLFFRFRDPAAQVLRRLLVVSFLMVLLGTVLFTIQMPLFVALVPGLLVFAVAYLLFLAGQAQMSRSSSALAAGVLGFVVIYPLLVAVFLADRPATAPGVAAARSLEEQSRPDEVVLSDQPWIPAWYADRPSLWIPVDEKRVNELRQSVANTRWLLLTEVTRGYSEGWQWIYTTLATLNAQALAYKAQGGTPRPIPISPESLPAALRQRYPFVVDLMGGTTWIPPVGEASRRTVIAALPPAPASASRPSRRAQLTRNTAASSPAGD